MKNEVEEITGVEGWSLISYNVLVKSIEQDNYFRWSSLVSAHNALKIQHENLNQFKEMAAFNAPENSIARMIKVRTDLILSLSGIILLFPVFMIIGFIIKVSSRGPVFFKQERIGFRGKKFKMYKFRTMVPNAEFQLDQLKAFNEASGPVFKIKHDPRITRVGRFLRRTGLDELPQLYNIINGDMSLIGPRPPLEEEVKQYDSWHLRRLSVIPGITCTWQISPNRHEVIFDEWVAMDLEYIDHWSLRKDFVLFFKTIRTFFLAGGH